MDENHIDAVVEPLAPVEEAVVEPAEVVEPEAA